MHAAMHALACQPMCPPQVWECEMDYEVFHESKELNPYDIPRNKDGSVVKCMVLWKVPQVRLSYGPYPRMAEKSEQTILPLLGNLGPLSRVSP